jgi:hypothetical protein
MTCPGSINSNFQYHFTVSHADYQFPRQLDITIDALRGLVVQKSAAMGLIMSMGSGALPY